MRGKQKGVLSGFLFYLDEASLSHEQVGQISNSVVTNGGSTIPSPIPDCVYVTEEFSSLAAIERDECGIYQIISPDVLQVVINKNANLAAWKSYGPLMSVALDGAVVCCTGVNHEQRVPLERMVKLCKGEWTRDFTRYVTHLVATGQTSEKYYVALSMKKDIVKPSWIEAVYTARTKLPIDPDHRLPTFANALVCVTGTDAPFRDRVEKLVIEGGGRYQSDLTKKVTILIAVGTGSTKYAAALKWGLKIVNPSWLDACVLAKGMVDPAKFPVDPGRLAQVNAQPPLPPEPAARSVERWFEGFRFFIAEHDPGQAALTNHLVRVIKHFGGTTPLTYNGSISHLITLVPLNAPPSDWAPALSLLGQHTPHTPYIIQPSWVTDCVKQKCTLDVNLYLHTPILEAWHHTFTQPAAPPAIPSASAAVADVADFFNARVKPDQPSRVVQPRAQEPQLALKQPEPMPQLSDSTSSTTWAAGVAVAVPLEGSSRVPGLVPPTQSLAQRTEGMPDLQDAMSMWAEAGATIFSTAPESLDEGASRFILVGHGSKLADRDLANIVGLSWDSSQFRSSEWFIACAKAQSVLPLSHLGFKPLPFLCPVPGLGAFTIAISGITLPDREYIAATFITLGFNYTETLSRSNTHLIIAEPSGRKYEWAIKKPDSVSIITRHWLDKVLTTGIISPPDVQDAGHFNSIIEAGPPPSAVPAATAPRPPSRTGTKSPAAAAAPERRNAPFTSPIKPSFRTSEALAAVEELQDPDAAVPVDENSSPQIFGGLNLAIDSSMKPESRERLERSIVKAGGVIHLKVSAETSAFLTDASSASRKSVREAREAVPTIRLIRVQWVHASLAARSNMPWSDFALVEPSPSKQRPAVPKPFKDTEDADVPKRQAPPASRVFAPVAPTGDVNSPVANAPATAAAPAAGAAGPNGPTSPQKSKIAMAADQLRNASKPRRSARRSSSAHLTLLTTQAKANRVSESKIDPNAPNPFAPEAVAAGGVAPAAAEATTSSSTNAVSGPAPPTPGAGRETPLSVLTSSQPAGLHEVSSGPTQSSSRRSPIGRNDTSTTALMASTLEAEVVGEPEDLLQFGSQVVTYVDTQEEYLKSKLLEKVTSSKSGRGKLARSDSTGSTASTTTSRPPRAALRSSGRLARSSSTGNLPSRGTRSHPQRIGDDGNDENDDDDDDDDAEPLLGGDSGDDDDAEDGGDDNNGSQGPVNSSQGKRKFDDELSALNAMVSNHAQRRRSTRQTSSKPAKIPVPVPSAASAAASSKGTRGSRGDVAESSKPSPSAAPAAKRARTRGASLDAADVGKEPSIANSRPTRQAARAAAAAGEEWRISVSSALSHLEDKVKMLGGKLYLSQNDLDKCNILVVASVAKSARCLLACMKGMWVVKAEWVTESVKHGRWLNPGKFEWTGAHELTEAPRHWRLKLASGGKRPFQDLKAWMAATGGQGSSFTDVFEAGGGIVIGGTGKGDKPLSSWTGDEVPDYVFVNDWEGNEAEIKAVQSNSRMSGKTRILTVTFITESIVRISRRANVRDYEVDMSGAKRPRVSPLKRRPGSAAGEATPKGRKRART